MIHPVRRDNKHRYWRPGPQGEVQVPGFTEVGKVMGIIEENDFHTAEGRERGVSLHKWLLFLAQGKAPTSHPDPRIAGKVEGIRKFMQDTKFQFAGGEEPAYDPCTNTACTPDLWGFIGSWFYVIDAKGGAKQSYHSIQTACQQLALTANGFRIQKRAALYLKDNAYRLEPHSDYGDIDRWKHTAYMYHKKSS